MRKLILSLSLMLSLLSLSGCSLIPKRVELFQSKVQRFPELTNSQKELQKEVAQRAKEKAAETLLAATAENTSTNVISPAHEAAVLTDAVAESVGAPAKRPSESSQALADELRKSVAKLDRKIDAFQKENDKVAGKKIEDTGLIKVPYFMWAGGILVVIFVFWHLAKTALTVASAGNPGALVGVGAMNVAGSVVSRGFQQLVHGGEGFLTWVKNEIPDSALQQKIMDAFITRHKVAQDSDIKQLVKHLTGSTASGSKSGN